MEELQKTPTIEIDRQLKKETPNIQYLDLLNRLLGTVKQLVNLPNWKKIK
jgi:hypothetical protein